ncbi:hypothetical protein JI59_13865 [Novosphingobium pentaromativorans US6-1]|nr:hypothetical protein JI59_13865 [Novosphingobium pentaromativorans US6-1]
MKGGSLLAAPAVMQNAPQVLLARGLAGFMGHIGRATWAGTLRCLTSGCRYLVTDALIGPGRVLPGPLAVR